MNTSTRAIALLASLALLACAQTPEPEAKPAADPDQATAAAKADGVSNVWTTIVGELPLDGYVKAPIDYPDWFHGYTLELQAGQSVLFDVAATEDGYARIYGPAVAWSNGEPLFGKPIAKGDTDPRDGAWGADVTLEIAETGTYLFLYGPKYTWEAHYTLTATCVGGCDSEVRCDGDDACAADEYCGHNGVVCFTTPCDVAYDICKPREPAFAWCDRDRVCADGYVCGPDSTCVKPPPATGCETTDDCAEGFCKCDDMSCTTRSCAAYSAEGEGCGGFVPANMVRMCEPELQCVAPMWIADIPGRCGVQVTVQQLLDDPKAWDGRFVAIDGFVANSLAYCTKMACSEANPCCNTCGAEQRVYDAELEYPAYNQGIGLLEDGDRWSCNGNECTWSDNCTAEAGRWLLAGWFHYDGEYDLSLAITSKYKGF